MSPKKLGKAFLCLILESQVKRLRSKNKFQLVAVAGSAGKTSTKLAIASVLGNSRRVISQSGNYNDRLTVPLVLFGHEQPAMFNLWAWTKILWRNQKLLSKPYDYDIAVVEIGTDAPGQLSTFAYLKPDLTVITSIAAEHMEYFGSLEAVAREELVPLAFSTRGLLNVDDIPKEYLPEAITSYGLKNADYSLTDRQNSGLNGQELSFSLPQAGELTVRVAALGDQGAKIILAAVAVADVLGLAAEEIELGVREIKPVAGRMQLLPGQQESTLIDDTYNATPVAMQAALEVLQTVEAPQSIAILGSMNELGEGSEGMHRQIGEQCDPQKLNLVVTIGKAAAEWLAPAAKQKGCQVECFSSPYEAGEYVLDKLKPGAVVLAKGSQNGVFAEEALKPLLDNPANSQKLVRQSAYWLKQKQKSLANSGAAERT